MRRLLLETFFRLFTVQGSWSFERLQGIGIAVGTEPLLRSLPGGKGGPAYRRALARAAGYFNTHPYFAGLAVGALARAEHDELPEADIERLRSALKGALGALGDRLVWNGILPAAVAAGLLAGTLASPVTGAVVLLVTFNAVHLPLRFWSLPAGWRLGASVVKALQHPLLQRGATVFRTAAVLALGVAIPLVADRVLADFEPTARVGALAVAGATVVFTRWLVPSVGAARLGTLAVLGALIAGSLWP